LSWADEPLQMSALRGVYGFLTAHWHRQSPEKRAAQEVLVGNREYSARDGEWCFEIPPL